MSKSLDLNCDVGEVDAQRDQSILPFVSSCNVSCGAHAGDLVLIEKTIQEALRLGVSIGAHPSYPDRTNFGRKTMDLPINELAGYLREQISNVQTIVQSLGGELSHVKPHGALYNDMTKDNRIAETVIAVIEQTGSALAVYGQADSHLEEICAQKQLRFVHEVFGDRRYEDQTTLRSRSHPDAILRDESEFQTQFGAILNGYVMDVYDRKHSITTQTICLHSDTPLAVEFAKLAHQYLKEHDVQIAAP